VNRSNRLGSAVGAAFTGIVDQLKGGGVRRETSRMDGKNVLITGANSGLGFGIAQRCAELGANVWMACRSSGKVAAEKVREHADGGTVEVLDLDLVEPLSIERLVESLVDRGVHLDVLICNAGAVSANSVKTWAGLERMVHTNFLGHTMLVQQLRAAKVLSNREQTPRVIFVGSEAHRSAPPIDEDQWHRYEEFGVGEAMARYGASKLLVHTWATELARRTEGELLVYSMCPGAVNSSIAREAPSWTQPLLKVVFGVFFQSPYKAALPVVYLASSSEVVGKSGMYLHLKTEKPASDSAIDPAQGAMLWRSTADVVAKLWRRSRAG